MGVLRLSSVCAIVAMLMLVSASAHAQYFGRNKVEYTDFDFRILVTEHFDVYYYSRETRAAQIAAQLAERWYSRISRVMRHELDRRQPLVMYGSQAEFAQTNVVSGLLPDSVGGVTESSRRRIVMPFAPTMAETDRVLGHEIVHAFQFDIARRHGGGTGQPLWFIEGMAEYLARGSTDAEAGLWLRDVVRSERLPRRHRDAVRQLSPYQYGHAFWSYLGHRFGDDVVEKALKPDKKHRKVNDRIRYATGHDLETLHADWYASVQQTYGASRGSDPVTLWSRGGMQLGPALSPDGKQAVFFSERDRLSMDLFLADVPTGRIVRKLATTAASARFDSLQAFRSSGAWSPNGEWFVFPAVRQGHAALMLIAMTEGGQDREFVFTELGQVLSASWSPDGTSIALSALAGGFTDLYTFELSTHTLQQLTDDPFADLQPAWSHDGRRLAFVSERYSSDASSLQFGRPQLAIMDLALETVVRVDVGDSHAQLSPQWSRGDEELYFVGDIDGSANVYRVALNSSALVRLTRVDTGVSGVTPMSPALSVADAAPIVAFTVYERGRPQLVVLDEAKATGGTPVVDQIEPSLNPPQDLIATRGLVDRVRDDQETGLPDSATLRDREVLVAPVTREPRAALSELGWRPVRHIRPGWRRRAVRGHARRTPARRGRADRQSASRRGIRVSLPESGAAMELGPRHRARARDPPLSAECRNRTRRSAGAAEGDGLSAADAVARGRPSRVSVQPRPARRVERRRAARPVSPRAALADLLVGHRSRAGERVPHPTWRRADHGGGGERRARARHDRLRRDGPAARIALSVRDRSRDWRPVLHPHRRRLPQICDAGAALLDRRPGAALGALWSRWRRPAAACPVFSGRVPSCAAIDWTCAIARRTRRACAATSCLAAGCWSATSSCGFRSGGCSRASSTTDRFRPMRSCSPTAAWCGRARVASAGIRSIGGGVRLNAGGLPFEIVAIRALDGPMREWQYDFGFRVGF